MVDVVDRFAVEGFVVLVFDLMGGWVVYDFDEVG